MGRKEKEIKDRAEGRAAGDSMRLKTSVKMLLIIAVFGIFAAGCADRQNKDKEVIHPQQMETTQLQKAGEETGGTQPNADSATVRGMLFDYVDSIYFYDIRSRKVTSYGKGSGLCLSPDKQRIAFRTEDSFPPVIRVIRLSTGDSRDIEVKNEYGVQMMGFSWVNDQELLVEGHVNPSVEGYVLYDGETGEDINDCGGRFYGVLPDHQSLLFGLTPHIFPTPAANIQVMTPKAQGNEMKQLYQVPSSKDIIFDAKVTEDQGRIVILDYSSRDKKLYARMATLDPKAMKLGNMKKMPIVSGLNLQNEDTGSDPGPERDQVHFAALSGDGRDFVLWLAQSKEKKSEIQFWTLDMEKGKLTRTKTIPVGIDLNGYIDMNTDLVQTNQGTYKIQGQTLIPFGSMTDPIWAKMEPTELAHFKEDIDAFFQQENKYMDIQPYVQWVN